MGTGFACLRGVLQGWNPAGWVGWARMEGKDEEKPIAGEIPLPLGDM